jgi:hypothetical protein
MFLFHYILLIRTIYSTHRSSRSGLQAGNRKAPENHHIPIHLPLTRTSTSVPYFFSLFYFLYIAQPWELGFRLYIMIEDTRVELGVWGF